jgi:hypothetical protein
MRAFTLILIAASGALAQAPQATAPTADMARGSISGVIRVQGTGDPVPDADVSARHPGAKAVGATTDQQGRYTLPMLAPGAYTVEAAVPAKDGIGFPTEASRPVMLQADQDLTGIDMQVPIPGQISGKVMDENGEPLAKINVMLVAREYSSGALRYVFAEGAATDDQGKYTLARVMPGRAFLLLAMKLQRQLPAVSNAPDDPQLRRPVPVATYYPGSPDPEGAEPLVLRTAESREGVNIRMRKAAAYCLEAVVSGTADISSLGFSIALQRPTSGQSGNGGMYMGMPGGKVPPDGKVRICELYPADYELDVTRWGGLGNGPDFLGTLPVTIADRDVAGGRVTALPKIPLPGEVQLYGPASQTPLEAEITIDLRSLTRTTYPTVKSSIPGQFSFDGLVPDEYSLEVRGLPAGFYVKDVTYGGQSVLRKSLRIGSATADAAVRLLVAPDGGHIAAKVANGDGNPVGNASVLLIPASASSEAELAAFLQTGVTNQNGTWRSGALAPGKYFALASPDAMDKSPESIGKLWRARTQAEEIDLQANQTAQVSLAVKGLE